MGILGALGFDRLKDGFAVSISVYFLGSHVLISIRASRRACASAGYMEPFLSNVKDASISNEGIHRAQLVSSGVFEQSVNMVM